MIAPVDSKELYLLLDLAEEFYASSKFLKGFDKDSFITNWARFIDLGVGAIFGYVNTNGEVVGAIGGIASPGVHGKALVANELFWFVSKKHSGVAGIRLIEKFESWAKEVGCEQIIMVSLSDLTPGKLKKIYERRGYTAMETHYIKELK